MRIFKKILTVIIRIGISIALLFLLFRQVDVQNMLRIMKGAHRGLLLVGFVFTFFSFAFCFVRWRGLLNAAEIRIPFKRTLISFSGGIFFNLFLPSAIGGDFVRSIDLAMHTKKPRQIVASVLLDRISGYAGLVLLVLCALALGGRLVFTRAVLVPVAIIASVLGVILLALFNEFVYKKLNKILAVAGAGRFWDSIRNLHEELYIFRRQRKALFLSVFFSLIVQIVNPIAFFFIALALGVKVSIVYFFVFLPIIGAITMLPISLGGLGVRDATTIFFFGLIGVAKDLAFAMSLLGFFFVIIFGAFGGLIYVLTVHHRRLQSYQPPSF